MIANFLIFWKCSGDWILKIWHLASLFLGLCRPLTFSWRRLLSYRNQSTDLTHISVDWFLYDNDLRHERVKENRYLLLLSALSNTMVDTGGKVWILTCRHDWRKEQKNNFICVFSNLNVLELYLGLKSHNWFREP